MNKPAFAGLFGSNLWDRILQSEAAVEGAVLAGPLPGIANRSSRVKRFRGVTDFAILQWHERRIPNQLRHLDAPEGTRATAEISGSDVP